MKTNGAWSAAALTILIALAGCVGASEGSDDSASAPTGGFDESTGAVNGVVLTEEALPVAAAQVASLQGDVQTLTDDSGSFTLGGLEPGRHVIAVSKLGFDVATQSVDVVAGQATQVQLELTAIVVHEAYHESFPKAGYFECTWRYSAVLIGASGPCGYTNVNGTIGNPLEEHVFTQSERKWNYLADPGAMTVMNEMEWTAGSAATGDNLRIFFSYADRTAFHTFCQADGYTPLTMKWEREEAEENADWECVVGSDGNQPSDEPDTIDLEDGMKLQTFVSVGVMRAGGVSTGQGFAYDQRFDIWFSLFYWEPAPDDYSALQDA